MKQKRHFAAYFIIISIVFSLSTLAQKVDDKQNEEKKETKINSIQGTEEAQASGDKVIFKDGATSLIEFENFDGGGSIKISEQSTVTTPGNNLYNFNGDLYWKLINLSSASAAANNWTISGNNIYNSNSGNVGINSSSPKATLSINTDGNTSAGIFVFPPSGGTFGVDARSFAPGGAGIIGTGEIGGKFNSSWDEGIAVKGSATNGNEMFTNYGGFFEADGVTARGVYGIATSSTGKNYGGEFISNGPAAFGSHSEATGAGGIGVKGLASDETTTNFGGYFEGKGKFGYGVYAIASDASSGIFQGNTGGFFTANAEGGVGVQGVAAKSGNISNTGGSFQANGDLGIGVSGYAGADNVNNINYGGKFEAVGPFGYGIHAKAPLPNGWAGYFVGDAGVSNDLLVFGTAKLLGNADITGNLSKGSGSFKIDHPLDPTNKILYHSFVESPDMMNIYNGNVILNSSGEAIVELADWFEALNMEFRYQLTAIGAPGPNLYIAEEINGNQFRIAGGTASMKVSWQVTGIRHDAYAEANRIEVEVDKNSEEIGKYLYPKVYNQPETMGVNYSERKERIRIANKDENTERENKFKTEHSRIQKEQERVEEQRKIEKQKRADQNRKMELKRKRMSEQSGNSPSKQ